MSDVEPLPTFASNWDRFTFLLAEYKIPLSVMVLAASIWTAWASPQLPTPPDSAMNASLAAFMLALPTYISGLRIAKYLYPGPPRVKVGFVLPGETFIYDGKKVATELWEEKTVVGPRPLTPDEGMFDYIVTGFEHYEEVDEIEVRGVERADMEPGEAIENAARVDEYYEHHHKIRRSFSRLKAKVLGKATDVHDLTIMSMMAEREQADLAPGVNVTDMIEEMEALGDELPTSPQDSESRDHLDQLDDQLGDLDPADVPGPEPNDATEIPIADGGPQE